MTALQLPAPYAHDGQIELIERLLATHNWQVIDPAVPIATERTAAISMAFAVVTRLEMKAAYVTAGLLNTDAPLGAQVNQVLASIADQLSFRGRAAWAPLAVPEAFSMIRWLLTTPPKP